MRPITSHTALFGLLAFHLASCSSGSAEKMDLAIASAGPSDANLTATVKDQPDFNACGAYAYTSMGYTSIIGNDDKSWITIGFLTKDRSAIVPGTFVISNGALIPAGQGFAVDFVYKEGSSALEHTFLSRSGTLTLTVADGDHYKGSFSGPCTRMKGEKDVREVSGAFDVLFDETKSLGKRK